MDKSTHKQISKLKTLMISISMIMLIVSALLTSLFIYLSFAEPHSGDFCDLVQTRYDSDYDFVINEGVGCKLIFSGLEQSFVVFVIFNMVFQIPLWTIYFLIKSFKKTSNQKTN